MTHDETIISSLQARAQQARDAADSANLELTPELVAQVSRALASLDWRAGLTRAQIRRKAPHLSRDIFLRLPSSKRYGSAREVLHDAGIAASRAEGDFLGPDPTLPEEDSVAEGGPPAWGPSPLFTIGGAVDGGSAEDSTGLVEDE
jgi:hypothetical protein